MSARSEKLLEQVLSLPNDEQAELIDELLSRIGSPIDPDIEKLWVEESERRISAFERGEIKPVAADEVFKRIEESEGR